MGGVTPDAYRIGTGQVARDYPAEPAYGCPRPRVISRRTGCERRGRSGSGKGPGFTSPVEEISTVEGCCCGGAAGRGRARRGFLAGWARRSAFHSRSRICASGRGGGDLRDRSTPRRSRPPQLASHDYACCGRARTTRWWAASCVCRGCVAVGAGGRSKLSCRRCLSAPGRGSSCQPD